MSITARASVTLLWLFTASHQSVVGQSSTILPQPTVNRNAEVRVPEFETNGSPLLLPARSSPQFPIYRANQFPTIQPQNEPSVRISSKAKNRIVAAYRDFRLGSNPAIRNIGIASTADGGLTWSERLFTYKDHDRYSDPSVAMDTAGNFYVVGLSYSTRDPSNIGNALSLMKSTDGGATWFSVAPAIERVPDIYLEDREIIYVDDSPTSPYSGNIYVSWTRFPSSGGATFIHCARSTNGGASFDPPVIVSDAGNVQHSMPTTGPDGELYVAWANSSSIRVDVSTDGGMTFGTDRVVSTPSTAPLWNGSLGAPNQVRMTVSGYPSLAVDKTFGQSRGTAYAVWATRASGDCDIVCSKSTNHGASWSTPVRVNDDSVRSGRDQFFSWVAVDEQGYVDVVFLDRRHDPANLMCDAYFAQSQDGGASFANYRITSQSFDPSINYNADTRFGDYMGIDARLGRIVPIFTSTAAGNQDVYIAVIDSLTVTAARMEPELPPETFSLQQNYPNPFNPSTRIDYFLPRASEVSLKVYNLLGQEIAALVDGTQATGSYSVTFNGRRSDGSELPSGTYLYALRTPNGRDTRKMILLR